MVVPEGFPVAGYEHVYDIVMRRHSGHAHCEHLAGAWNAIPYRYQAARDAGVAFAESVTAHGAAPQADIRYRQERSLFDYYSAGFSVFECTCYGLYAIGSFLRPDIFLLATARDQQRVSPTSTRDAFNRAFPADSICTIFATLFADRAYQEWREVRNVLTHRTSPGRRMYVSIGTDEELPTEWKLNNAPLDASLPAKGGADLARLLALLLDGAATFAASHLDPPQHSP
ncbi:MAG TPA: hypothetical protein PLF26_17245 [Blastocatellia bacterium]|nr:hypothetical protein [Blastocatellia bacterium]